MGLKISDDGMKDEGCSHHPLRLVFDADITPVLLYRYGILHYLNSPFGNTGRGNLELEATSGRGHTYWPSSPHLITRYQ